VPESTIKLYQQALKEGAKYIIGPLTKEEIEVISHEPNQASTLMLNKTQIKSSQPRQFFYGLSTSDEIQQIIKIAHNLGMHKATVIASNTDFSQQTSQDFKDYWVASGGQLSLISADNNDIKKQIIESASEMIFIAEKSENARLIRTALPTNIPTFGLSEIFSGVSANADDAPLRSILFVDCPWMIDRGNPKFSGYTEAAADLPPGEMQRWFALGADSYQILIALDRLTSEGTTIDGLSGKISITANGEIRRSLDYASFGAESIILEASQ